MNKDELRTTQVQILQALVSVSYADKGRAKEGLKSLVAEVERLQQQAEAQASALEALRAAARMVIEQADLSPGWLVDEITGLPVVEFSMDREQVEALRAALQVEEGEA